MGRCSWRVAPCFLLLPSSTDAHLQLDALDAAGATPLSGATSVEGVPPGFLAAFATACASDGAAALQRAFGPVVAALPARVAGVSPLGDYSSPLSLLAALATTPGVAAALASHPAWLGQPQPRGARGAGRAMESSTILGPFLGLSPLMDQGSPTERAPSCAELLAHAARRSDADAAFATFHRCSVATADALTTVLKAMLTAPPLPASGGGPSVAPRDAALNFVARFVADNAGRCKTIIDTGGCASHGAAVNLCAVMLRLCAPFFGATPEGAGGDAKAATQFSKLDASYLTRGRVAARLGPTSVAEETRVAATAAEAAAYAAEAQSQPLPPGGYHFIVRLASLTS